MSGDLFLLIPVHKLLVVPVVHRGGVLESHAMLRANIVLVKLRLNGEGVFRWRLLEVKELRLVHHWIWSTHPLANPELIIG